MKTNSCYLHFSKMWDNICTGSFFIALFTPAKIVVSSQVCECVCVFKTFPSLLPSLLPNSEVCKCISITYEWIIMTADSPDSVCCLQIWSCRITLTRLIFECLLSAQRLLFREGLNCSIYLCSCVYLCSKTQVWTCLLLVSEHVMPSELTHFTFLIRLLVYLDPWKKRKKYVLEKKNHGWHPQSLFPKGTTADIYIPDCKYKVNILFKTSVHKINVVLFMLKGNKKQTQISSLAKWLSLPGLICICVSLLILHPRQTADKSNKRFDMYNKPNQLRQQQQQQRRAGLFSWFSGQNRSAAENSSSQDPIGGMRTTHADKHSDCFLIRGSTPHIPLFHECICVYVCVCAQTSLVFIFLSPPSPWPSPSPTVSWGLRSLFSWKSGWIQFSLPSHMTSSSYSFTLPLLCPSLRPPLLLLYLSFTPRLFLLTVLICSLSFFFPTLHGFPPLVPVVFHILFPFVSDALLHQLQNFSKGGGKKTKQLKQTTTGLHGVNVQMCCCKQQDSSQCSSTVVAVWEARPRK